MTLENEVEDAYPGRAAAITSMLPGEQCIDHEQTRNIIQDNL